MTSGVSANEKTQTAPSLRYAAATGAFGALLYTLAMPPFGFGLLAFVVPLPIAILFLDPERRVSWPAVIAAGLVFGEGATLGVGGHWLYEAAHSYFGRSVGFSLGFTFLTTITHAGAFIAMGVIASARMARLGKRARVLGFAAMWVAWELARSRILYGCPWDLLGHALYDVPLLIQAADAGGVWILSFACAAAAATAAVAWHERKRGWRAAAVPAAIACGFPLLLAAYGAADIAPTSAETGAQRRLLRVGLVQTNIGRHELWRPELHQRHLDTLIELSRSAELEDADLIVWSENAVPFLLDSDRDAQARIARLARETGAAILLGAPRSEAGSNGATRFYNSVYLFRPETPLPSGRVQSDAPDHPAHDGRRGARPAHAYETYDKVTLLPYIEETPVWARSIVGKPAGIEYVPGAGRVLFEVAGWRVAPMICFESTYPENARAYARDGADLFVNISNDSWFDRGAAPEQHFAMTLFRSVENRLPTVRVANTGVSAVVDEHGRIVERLPAKTRAVTLVDVRPGANHTIYTGQGDRFAWLCVLTAAIAGVGSLAARRRAGDAPHRA